jgi:hypothetical protein
MFQKFAVAHGFEKRHYYIQCGFRKNTGANFNIMDLRIFMEFDLYHLIDNWIRKHNLRCLPYIKIEYARHPTLFNGTFVDIVTDLHHLKTTQLLKMKDDRPYSHLYVRLYYK